MLDFMLELEKVLKTWPDDTKWNLVQIADLTHSQVPHVVEYVTDALNKSFDIHEPVSFAEMSKAHAIIQERLHADLEKRRRREQQEVEKSVSQYKLLKLKVSKMETTKNWRAAYRTITYFYGLHKNRLPNSYVVEICDNCLRLGIKEKINIQELSQWLRCGIRTLLKSSSQEVVEDALDFLDAYGDYFLKEPNGRGEQFITNIFLTLKPSAMEFNLTPKLNEIAGELKLTAVMDVFA
tara:strand:+ start:359 stop:1069 length:711 start_codon:yes stop_codon:yes gene_type:complete